jgi:polysaccharide export outer membrane protein
MKIRGFLVLFCVGALVASVAGAEERLPETVRSIEEAYQVGVEDVLRIFVWGEPDLSGEFRVLPDGSISLPLAHDVPVKGMTTTQIRQAVTAALSEFINDPNVTVIVESIESYRVYFLGEVQRQGALQFYRPTRLMQGIAAAGGLTEFAKKEITLVRDQGGSEKRFRIDYKRLINGDPSQENIYLQPGDTLIFH